MKLKQLLKNIPKSPEEGYTIMEGLVAMIMVAALMVAVAPVIAFSVGTRVQARQQELAAQAARSYIDALRSKTIDPPGLDTGADIITVDNSLTSCTTGTYCTEPTASGQFYCVDGDNNGVCTPDSLADMLVYPTVLFASDGSCAINYATASDKSELNYPLSVRVYRARAFQDADKIEISAPSTYINNAGLATRKAVGSENHEMVLFSTQTEMFPSDGSFQQINSRLSDCN